MAKTFLSFLLLFVVLVLAQVTIFNHIWLFGMAMPLVFIYFIIVAGNDTCQLDSYTGFPHRSVGRCVFKHRRTQCPFMYYSIRTSSTHIKAISATRGGHDQPYPVHQIDRSRELHKICADNDHDLLPGIFYSRLRRFFQYRHNVGQDPCKHGTDFPYVACTGRYCFMEQQRITQIRSSDKNFPTLDPLSLQIENEKRLPT